MMDLIAIRPYDPTEDENFIFSTALAGLYYGDSWFAKIKKTLFITQYRKVLQAMIAKPTTCVRIACMKEDPTEIKGYSITVNHDHALAWVFVKKDWRKNGIAKTLVPTTVTEVTNLTALGEVLMKKYPHLSFNPFVI